MSEPILRETRDGAVAILTFDDPDRRNALGDAMFDALEAALGRVEGDDDAVVLLLTGAGRAFSAGFDLDACRDDPRRLDAYIRRLSAVCRRLRRMPAVTIVAAHGPAIAGGCAMLSAADVAVAAPDARIGYPVLRLGISPAVSAPTLIPAVGSGFARWMQLGGALIDGATAHRIGLVHHLAESSATTIDEARALADRIAGHGPQALRATKAWLNELDGSLDDARFEPVADATAREAAGAEARARLEELWGR